MSETGPLRARLPIARVSTSGVGRAAFDLAECPVSLVELDRFAWIVSTSELMVAEAVLHRSGAS